MSSLLTESEIDNYRKQFPVTEKYIYLDHSGVAPVSLRAVERAKKFLELASGFGTVKYDKFMEDVEIVRSGFAKLINSGRDEIAFVKNTSHGLSLLANGINWEKNDNLIVIDREFPTNLYPWINLTRAGVEVRKISLVNRKLNLKDLENAIDEKTRLLSISSVQYTNGYRADLESIGQLSRKHGFYFCVDAIQSLGIVPMDVRHYGIDFLAADGHKWLLSPEGTGIIYCRKEICSRIDPVLLGWKSVVHESDYENIDLSIKDNALKFEEGSFNVMGITALGGSLDLILEIGVDKIFNQIQFLGDIVIDFAKNRNFEINTPLSKEERGGIVSFKCHIDPLLIKERLLNRGIIVNVRDNALRVSPHFYNTAREIKCLFESIDDIVDSAVNE